MLSHAASLGQQSVRLLLQSTSMPGSTEPLAHVQAAAVPVMTQE